MSCTESASHNTSSSLTRRPDTINLIVRVRDTYSNRIYKNEWSQSGINRKTPVSLHPNSGVPNLLNTPRVKLIDSDGVSVNEESDISGPIQNWQEHSYDKGYQKYVVQSVFVFVTHWVESLWGENFEECLNSLDTI